MRWAWVCSRPAVSTIKTSVPRARAFSRASKATAAGSPPSELAVTGTPARSPQAAN